MMFVAGPVSEASAILATGFLLSAFREHTDGDARRQTADGGDEQAQCLVDGQPENRRRNAFRRDEPIYERVGDDRHGDARAEGARVEGRLRVAALLGADEERAEYGYEYAYAGQDERQRN